MSGVDVSVIVPCYNGARYLDQALSSIECNERARLQIICVNDGSTDDTLSIMEKHRQQDSRVVVLDKENAGYGCAVNRGISLAEGSYIAIAESDDFELPHMYDDLFDLASRYRLPDVVKSCYWRVCDADTAQERRYRAYVYKRIVQRKQPFQISDAPQLLQYHPSIWAGMYRRSFLEDKGIRLIEAPGGGWVDNTFLVETLCQAQTIVYTDACHYCYREDIAGTSTAARKWTVSYARWNERQDIIERLGIHDPGVLAANYVVGLKFVESALGQGVMEKQDGADATRKLLKRMDPHIVEGLSAISPAMKRCYARLTDASIKISPVAYRLYLAKEAWWGLRNNGLGFVLSNMKLSTERNSEASHE